MSKSTRSSPSYVRRQMAYGRSSAAIRGRKYYPGRHTLIKRTPFNGGAVGRGIGFPKMMKFKHRYCTQVSLTDSAGHVHYQMRANGLFDPDLSSTGHQPMWFDQLAGIYNHYTVIGSKIKYTVVPAGTTAQPPYKLTSWINDDSTSTGNQDALNENKTAKVRIVGSINPQNVVITNTWSAKKFFGGSVLAQDELKGNAGADPTELSLFQLTLKSIDGVSPITVHIFIELEYIVIWKELKEVANS